MQHEPHLHLIFWGSNWNGSGEASKKVLLKFVEGLTGSAYQGILTQYFDPTGRISSSVPFDSYVDTHVTAPKNVNDFVEGSPVEAEVQYALEHNPSWKRESNAQFAVLPAPGSTYAEGFTGFCAYHAVDASNGVYLMVPYAGDEPWSTEDGCQGYYGGGDPARATSLMLSHEYAEAATDPFWNTTPGWMDTEGYEIGDICSTPYDELPNGSYVQGQYDDHQNACSIEDANPPQVLGITEPATHVTAHGATLNGTINPESLATSYRFEYGATTKYGSSIPAEALSVGSGRANVHVEQAISGLTVEQTYHYRVVATNSSGTTYGEDQVIVPSKWAARSVPRTANWERDALGSVSCAGRERCMAVGEYRDPSLWPAEEVNRMLTLELINGQWVKRSVPQSTSEGYASLSSVSCPATTSCTAVGHYWNSGTEKWLPEVVHWNGSSWKHESEPLPTGAVEAELNGISCASTTECMAVGFVQSSPGVFENYSALLQGGVWKPVSTPTATEYSFGTLTGVDCLSSTWCTAVGWHNPKEGEAQKDIVHWNGTKWEVQTPGSASDSLANIDCTSTTFCMAVDSFHGGFETWNGSKWSVQTSPTFEDVSKVAAASVSCQSSTSCTAVGYGLSSVTEATIPLVVLWNGSSFTEQSTLRESEHALNLLSGVSCTGTKSCAAVGYSYATGELRSMLQTREMPVTPVSSSTVASSGTGNGQVTYPRGIAVDAEGNVWVADGNNNRVEEFNSKKEYLRQFGSSGTGNGQFNTPVDIAIDASGNLWVTDALNARVEKFNSKGEYLSQFGSYGGANGQFYEASGIAIDPSGNIWVSDHTGNRVEEFNSAGTYVRTISGTNRPEGLAADSEGHIWVAEAGANHVSEYSSTGALIRQFGSYGTGDGLFAEPGIIDIQPSGDLLVGDRETGRVQEFTATGEYLTQFGAGDLNEPAGIAVGGGGAIYVSNWRENRLERWAEGPMAVTQEAEGLASNHATLAGVVNAGGVATSYHFEYGSTTSYGSSVPVPDKSVGEGTSEVTVSQEITGLKPASTYHYRLVATNVNGTRYGKDLTLTTLGLSATYVSAFGSEGTGNGQFKHPGDVALDPEGNLWVVDETNNRVEKFNEKGEYLTKFGSTGSANGQLSRPAGVAIDAKGNIWVADAGNNRIEEFNSKGEYLAKIGSFGTGNGQFSGPEGVAIDVKGNIWVSDTYNGRVQEFNEKLEFVRVVGSKGSGSGQLGEPTGIDIGPGGNVWIADWQNNRVSEFNEKGEFMRQFGTEGSGNGQFLRPDAIAADGLGNIWVGDQNNGRVEAFGEQGEYTGQFGSKGTGTGQFSFSFPMGIATNGKGGIWVTDTNNNRVQRWSY